MRPTRPALRGTHPAGCRPALLYRGLRLARAHTATHGTDTVKPCAEHGPRLSDPANRNALGQPAGRSRGRCRLAGRRGGRAALMVGFAAATLVLTALPASAEAVHLMALAGSLDEVLTNLRTFIMGILALVATVFLTVGGVRYVMSSGDAGEVSKAKECFKNAVLGYALAALAPLVVQILRGIVGA